MRNRIDIVVQTNSGRRPLVLDAYIIPLTSS